MFCLVIILALALSGHASDGFSTAWLTVVMGSGDTIWRLNWPGGKSIGVAAPVWELDGQPVTAAVDRFTAAAPILLANGQTEQTFHGVLKPDTMLRLSVTFRWAQDNPVIRFRYTLTSRRNISLTKRLGRDDLRYCRVSLPGFQDIREVRLSAFNGRDHAYHPEEIPLSGPAAGPIVFAATPLRDNFLLLAYEHGSAFPDNFLCFSLQGDSALSVEAVKGNYFSGQLVSPGKPYETLWMEIAGMRGSEDEMASAYRRFILRYLAIDSMSRQPFIYYNTWGRQERTKWVGGKYLSGMNLATVLREIEVAHRLGVEVYVLDAGWFARTGDWTVNTRLFPDTLRRVKALLDRYGMKLGLWLNPTAAAVSGDLLRRNRHNEVEWQGKTDEPFDVWETEKSVRLDLVSSYWEDFADQLIRMSKEWGVSYFKWDAVGQYGCDAAGHFHGGAENVAGERADCAAFEVPIYLCKIAERLSQAVPEVILDLDLTEPGRCMGLAFLAAGKYFMMNNGPYFCDYDLSPPGKTPLANGNVNIFVNPGAARGWITRSLLAYDRWIPSVLMLTHFQLDGPRASQDINLASLVLGQNGIWGNILALSDSDIAYVGRVLSVYKQVREAITAADPVRTGLPGDDPEVVEKISGSEGAVSMFAAMPGRYEYITKHAVDRRFWASAGTQVSFDTTGRARIERDFTGAGTALVFFGVGNSRLTAE